MTNREFTIFDAFLGSLLGTLSLGAWLSGAAHGFREIFWICLLFGIALLIQKNFTGSRFFERPAAPHEELPPEELPYFCGSRIVPSQTDGITSLALSPERKLRFRLLGIAIFSAYIFVVTRPGRSSPLRIDLPIIIHLISTLFLMLAMVPGHFLLAATLNAIAVAAVSISSERFNPVLLFAYVVAFFSTFLLYSFHETSLLRNETELKFLARRSKFLFRDLVYLFTQAVALLVLLNYLIPEKRPEMAQRKDRRAAETSAAGSPSKNQNPDGFPAETGGSVASGGGGSVASGDNYSGFSETDSLEKFSPDNHEAKHDAGGVSPRGDRTDSSVPQESSGMKYQSTTQATEQGRSLDHPVGGTPSLSNKSAVARKWQRFSSLLSDEMREFLYRLFKNFVVFAGIILVLGFIHKLFIKLQPRRPTQARRSLSKTQRKVLAQALLDIEAAKISEREEIIRKYRIFLSMMAAIGHEKPEFLPPTDYCDQLSGRMPSIAGPLSTITHTFCDTFYGDLFIDQGSLLSFRRDFEVIRGFFLT